jgi:hypothetical protein
MKTTFLKGKYLLIDSIVSVALCNIGIIVGYLSTLNKWGWNKNEFLIFLLIAIAISIVFIFIILILAKDTLSKINISENGIQWLLFGKNIAMISWKEILDINVESRMMERCIVLKTSKKIRKFENQEIYFNIDKTNIKLLDYYCKIDYLSNKIKNIIKYKEYRRIIWFVKKRKYNDVSKK